MIGDHTMEINPNEKSEKDPSLRLRDFSPEEAKALCDYFDLLNKINQRCKAEGRPVIPDDGCNDGVSNL